MDHDLYMDQVSNYSRNYASWLVIGCNLE